MVKIRRVDSAARVGLVLVATVLGLASTARGLSTSDKPAAILVWPKIVVDTSGTLEGRPTDTIIQLSNTDDDKLRQAHCFYVNANGHCGASALQPGRICRDSTDCPTGTTDSGAFAPCIPGWSEIDFQIRITPEQPLVWRASEGLSMSQVPLPNPGQCSNNPTIACNPLSSINTCGSGTCVAVASNAGTGIPPAPEDPFVGTLKCIQFDPDQRPPAPDQSNSTNRFTGEAAIEACLESTCTNGVDVEKYNAVGFRHRTPVADHPGEVRMDGTQYEACPSMLILNHIFDNAPDPLSTATANVPTVTTDLTLVPCGDDFLRQEPGNATAQYLVFNEFEQRLSTSRKVDCFFESQISLIDTPNSTRSIFSFNVQGSLVGQTRIRGVGKAATGHGLIGVARALVGGQRGVAYNLQQSGNISGADIITIP